MRLISILYFELKIFKDHSYPTHINETIKLLESKRTMCESNSSDRIKDITSDIDKRFGIFIY